ncbi:MAG: hypothetical protein IJL38_07900 [Bacteroidales bacterium]|nr:hypothetical protein [Bacteroidales bacterium]
MKNNIYFIMMALAVLSIGVMGCKQQPKVETPAEDTVVVEQECPYLATIEAYLTNELAKNYAPGAVCIPAYSVVGIDDADEADIKVWGDWWVYNYDIYGDDTLRTVSGGNHPGLMHLAKAEEGYTVTSFEQTEDGAGNMESAKRIFGEKYDAFAAVNGDQKVKDSVRAARIVKYVKDEDLPYTKLQDLGMEPVDLPL